MRVRPTATMLLALALVSGCRRQPVVVCNLEYGGDVTPAVFPATKDPYRVRPVDVSGRFRFKVVYRALPVDSASASVYVYDAEHGDRLLQEGRYHAPFANGALEPGFGFTGKQLVYSANNRELGYSCELGVR